MCAYVCVCVCEREREREREREWNVFYIHDIKKGKKEGVKEEHAK